MQRCLQLACHGLGQVSPNPMVGAVIVHQEKIIGEGWHQGYGQAHAEVNAIKNTRETHAGADKMLQEATRSEEHTSELQSLMRISYAVFCLKKKKKHRLHR